MIMCNGNELEDLDELLVCVESELRKLQKDKAVYLCSEYETLINHETEDYSLRIWKVCNDNEREDNV